MPRPRIARIVVFVELMRTQQKSKMHKTALDYRNAGLCALPAIRAEKRPALRTWGKYQKQLPDEDEIEAWFDNGCDGICLLTGAASGNLEVIDFDHGGEAFEPWEKKVEAAMTGLLDRLVVETSQSGGWHVVYRCEAAFGGSSKLAQRANDDGRPVTLIETRGNGGLFLCAPTPRYELVQGELTNLPVLTEAEREALLTAARELNEYWPEPPPQTPQDRPCRVAGLPGDLSRPGDDFNARGDVVALLKRHGWRPYKTHADGNQHWTRPGKSCGTSATLKEGNFYVFSTNAAPFESERAYSPFAVYATLEQGGDFEAAARELGRQGYGQEPVVDTGVDISGIIGSADAAKEPEDSRPVDPGPIPEEMLRVPGFVSEVMDLCLETAPYPNLAISFCGALALQAFLAGRKVCDPGDNRTNIYLLGLAHSSAGKDWIRKLNAKILHEIGLASCLGDRLASGEGVQDVLFTRPSMLFQTDEIDGMLQMINRSKDARHENIMNTLLSLYSSANSVFSMRPKAGRPDAGVIDQPNLVLFGTAIPNHYYEALSERMLTNGFFARMLILEAGKRSKGKEPGMIRISERVRATSHWWANFRPGNGNLEHWHPIPVVVEHTDAARRLLVENREDADGEYARAEDRNDVVGTTVWGRVSEQTRKLALLYAVSENHQSPRIDKAAVEWAARFVVHQTRRMLFMAEGHVADNPFHAECLKVVQKLREAPGKELPHSILLKRMKTDARTFHEIICTLEQRGDLEIILTPRAGTAKRVYRLTE